MKKVLTKSILFSAMVIGLALASCTGKPKEQPAEQQETENQNHDDEQDPQAETAPLDETDRE